MSVAVRTAGCALGALATTCLLLMLTLAVCWAGGWSVSIPHVLAVAPTSGHWVDGVQFRPDAVGLVAVAGVLSTLFAVLDRPRVQPVRPRD